MSRDDVVVSNEVVQATMDAFTRLDDTGDKRTMNKMVRRLGKEQPALVRYAAALHAEHGEEVGRAALFYATVVWAMFDRHRSKKLPTLTEDNMSAAQEVVDEALGQIEGLDEKPAHERSAESLAGLQPHVYTKINELIAEDVSKEALTEDCARLIIRPTQVAIEAFDAALEGRRPGEQRGPLVRETPKVGRNEPCPCGSGKKYKRCHGAAV